MVLDERFPYKAAIYLDGHVCRGRANQCGAAVSFAALVKQVNGLWGLLGLDQVWIACQCTSQMKEVEQILGPIGRGPIEVYLSDPAELAWGMALEAETKWFGTIYSCTKNRIYPPQSTS